MDDELFKKVKNKMIMKINKLSDKNGKIDIDEDFVVSRRVNNDHYSLEALLEDL